MVEVKVSEHDLTRIKRIGAHSHIRDLGLDSALEPRAISEGMLVRPRRVNPLGSLSRWSKKARLSVKPCFYLANPVLIDRPAVAGVASKKGKPTLKMTNMETLYDLGAKMIEALGKDKLQSGYVIAIDKASGKITKLRRTVIVMAAIHWGFGRRLPCHQSPGPGHCDPLCEEAPLLLKLQGYFVEFLRESCLPPLGLDSPSVDEPCGGTLRCFTLRQNAPLPIVVSSWQNLLAVSTSLPPLSLSGHLGALASDLGYFPLNDEAYPLSSRWSTLTPVILSQLLRLNAFRGEPASSGFEWHFTPNHNSSVDSSTSVGSDLHLVSPKLNPGHG
ncbi:RuvB-like protein 2 [Tanacetum coccineum]